MRVFCFTLLGVGFRGNRKTVSSHWGADDVEGTHEGGTCPITNIMKGTTGGLGWPSFFVGFGCSDTFASFWWVLTRVAGSQLYACLVDLRGVAGRTPGLKSREPRLLVATDFGVSLFGEFTSLV